MKKKGQRIFFKIFTYTVVFVLLICLTAVLLFWRQFLSFYRREQVRQLSESFQPIIATITEKGRTPEEMAIIASAFADSNQSFRFQIKGKDGNVLFTTVDSTDEELPDSYNRITIRTTTVISDQIPLSQIPIGKIPIDVSGDAKNGFVFVGYGPQIDYRALALRSLLGVSIMLAVAVLGAFIFARKITKPLEDEIVREKAVEESQRLFFSAASHELKTPIAAARALVESMIANVGDYRDHPKYLRECLNTLDSQAYLVSEILEIVKLSDADAESRETSLDLVDLGGTVLAEYRPLAEQRGLLIQGDFPHVSVKADRNLLQRVLSNVMANAVQNTPEGGTIRIEAVEGINLRLSLTNTGARIPEEAIARLFEPFYRLDTARTRHGSQSGLGLAIVKKALDRMGFPFALENSNEGVVFWVELPVCLN